MVIDTIKKVRLISLFALAAFPLLMPHLISLATIFFLITTFVVLVETKDFSFDFKKFILVSLPFFIYLMGLVFSDHWVDGFGVVQKKLLILILPFAMAFRTTAIDDKLSGKLFLVFELAAAAIALYTNLMIQINDLVVIGDATDIPFLYRESISLYSNMHPTYYCAILFWAAFLSINNLFRDWQKVTRTPRVWIEVVLSAILITSAMAGAARAPMIAFGAIMVVWIFMKSRNAGKTWVGFVLIGLVLASMFALPAMRSRLMEISFQNMQAPSHGNDNGTNVRSGIFLCNIELAKQHWLSGVGTGDVQHALNDCFSKYETDVYDKFDFNTHNEYLNALFTFGILGLMLLLVSLFLSYRLAWRQKHYTHLYFLVFMSLCFFTENYFERIAGVMLFAWFQCLFVFSHRDSAH